MDVDVRGLGASDLDDLVQLEKVCFSHSWTRKQFLMGLELGSFRLLGIRTDGQLVGYIAFSMVEDEMEILNLAVHPDFRKKKLGSALMEKTFDVCLSEGAVKSFLDVRESNEPAIALYKKYGYEQYGVRKRYYPDTKEDALLFSYDFNS